MKWNIVTDSSCDLFPSISDDGEVMVSSVPFVISAGNQDFVDDETLNPALMLDAMEGERAASRTSCPSPEAWLTQFEQADNVIAITISSQLSGSMNSAQVARGMAMAKHPGKKIAVLDSRSTGPELVLCVEEIKRRIAEGMKFEGIVLFATNYLNRVQVSFALCSFDNLVKNGRLSKVSGFLAKTLRMWGVGIGTQEGRIEVVGRVRGATKAMKRLLFEMGDRGYRGGRASISHCCNPELATSLAERIRQEWADADVTIQPTRGLCSYYAERGGVILAFEQGR